MIIDGFERMPMPRTAKYSLTRSCNSEAKPLPVLATGGRRADASGIRSPSWTKRRGRSSYRPPPPSQRGTDDPPSGPRRRQARHGTGRPRGSARRDPAARAGGRRAPARPAREVRLAETRGPDLPSPSGRQGDRSSTGGAAGQVVGEGQ